MSDIRGAAEHELQPRLIHAYADVIRIASHRPFARELVRALSDACGHGVREEEKPRRRYRFEYSLFQPTRAALELLLPRDDIVIDYVEVALDLIFSNREEHIRADEFVQRHIVQRHKPGFVSYQGAGDPLDVFRTKYSAQRDMPNVIVVYSDKRAKDGDHPFTVHIEWRLSGPATLRRAGMGSVAQLLAQDRRAFWEHRLILAGFAYADLGRRALKVKRDGRSPLIARHGRFAYDVDAAAGRIAERRLMHQLEKRRSTEDEEWGFISVQELIEERYPSGQGLRLIRMDTVHLLPEPGPLLFRDRIHDANT